VTAHISLTRPGSGGISNYQALSEKIAADGWGALGNAGDFMRRCCCRLGGQARGVVTKGIDVEREKEKAMRRWQKLTFGTNWIFSTDADGIDGLIVGKQLSGRMEIAAGGITLR